MATPPPDDPPLPHREPALTREEAERLLLTGDVLFTISLPPSVGSLPIGVQLDNGVKAVLKWSIEKDHPKAHLSVLNELSASRLCTILGYDLVPPTVLRYELGGKKVPEFSLQLIVDGDENGDLGHVPGETLRQACTVDILTVQVDRDHNWFVLDHTTPVGLALIDNGCAFDWEPVGTVDGWVAGQPYSVFVELASSFGGPDLSTLPKLLEPGARAPLDELLDQTKVDAVIARAHALLLAGDRKGADVVALHRDDRA